MKGISNTTTTAQAGQGRTTGNLAHATTGLPETGVQRIDFSGGFAAANADGLKTATTGTRA